jgi:hypothetical protein
MIEEKGGPIALSKNWAKSLLYRLRFVKRKGSTSRKVPLKRLRSLRTGY